MARSEARISVDVWDLDPDWATLGPNAQWMYMLLLSQRDLAHDGVIALRERRWARAANNLSIDYIRHSLDELADARFIVIDRDTEEVLVRSLLRRDKIFRQPNVLRAAADHLPLVASHTIRIALAAELARIAQEDMPEGSRTIIAEMRAALPDPSPNPSENPSPEGSADPTAQGIAGTPGVRGVVTAVTTGFPVPRSPKSPYPEPRETPAGSPRARARAKPATRIPDDFEPDDELVAWARKNASATSRADHEAFVDYWRAQPGQRGTKADWRATWRTWMRREQQNHDRRNGARASPVLVDRDGLRLKPETAARLDDRARFEAMDAAEVQQPPAIGGPEP